MQTNAVLHKLAGHTSSITGVTFSPDGARIASMCWDKSVKLWDARTGAELRTLTGHSSGVGLENFSPSGFGEAVRMLTEIISGFRGVTFNSDGTLLAAASDNSIELWVAEAAAEFRTLVGHGDFVTGVAYSSDGLLVLAEDNAGNKLAWNAETGN